MGRIQENSPPNTLPNGPELTGNAPSLPKERSGHTRPLLPAESLPTGQPGAKQPTKKLVNSKGKGKGHAQTNKRAKVDVGKALAMKASGMTDGEIAKFFGVARQTVGENLRKYARNLLPYDTLQTLENARHDMIASGMHTALKYSMDPAKLEKASYSQLTMGFGILYDKLRLEEGKSTSNVAVLDIFQTVRDYQKRKQLENTQ